LRSLDLLILSGKNIFRAGTRTFLCVLAICIGISSVTVVLSLGALAGDSVQKEIERVGIGGVVFYSKSGREISTQAMETIAQTPGIHAVMPLALTTGTVYLRSIKSPAGILGIDTEIKDVFHLEVLHGALPNPSQIRNCEKIAVIDEEFAQKAYKRTNIIGKTLGVHINGNYVKLKICAVIRSQAANISMLLGGELPYLIYMPYTTLSSISHAVTPDKLVASITEEAHSSELLEQVLSGLNRCFDGNYAYENLNKYLDSFTIITDTVALLISGIAAISIIVGGLGVMNAMVAAVETRTCEIGIYRALGAKKRVIIQNFIFEAMILCLTGGVCGVLLSKIIFTIAQLLIGITIRFPWSIVGGSILTSMVCGVLFGLLPALRAARLDPIKAIRME